MFGDYFHRFLSFTRQRMLKFMAPLTRRRISLAPAPQFMPVWVRSDPRLLPKNRRIKRAEASHARHAA